MPIGSTGKGRDGRNALLCGLGAVVAILATWPSSGSPFNDDFSYAFTVKRLVETGHLTYNGWASASVIAQAYWGAMWVKMAGGFSYDVLRFSTVPLSAGAVAVVYLLGRRAGLAAGSAAVAAMTLAGSPLFLPVAASFMTDVPGLFCIVVSLYAVVRAIGSVEEEGEREDATSAKENAKKNWTWAGWVAVAVVVGLVGGTGRQVVWVAPLATLPVAAWVWRRDRWWIIPVAGWVVVLTGATGTMRWFARQPYAIPEPSIVGDLIAGLRGPVHFGMNVLAIALTAVLAILPATVGTWRWRDRRWRWGFVVAAVLIGGGLWLRPEKSLMPWMENTITPTGILGQAELAGDRPTVLPMLARQVVSVAVWGTVFAGVACAGSAFKRGWRVENRGWPSPSSLHPPSSILVLLTFAAAYTATLLPRAARDMAFDRYVLPLMPCLMIPLLRWRPVSGKSRAVAWALLVALGIFGIATTQEVTSLARARIRAADQIMADGVPRTDIDAGFEYDYWTELLTTGHINDQRVTNPPFPGGEPTPSVQALYRLEYTPAVDTKPTAYPVVWYFSLLPPFWRPIYTREFVQPIWRDPEYRRLHRMEHKHVLIRMGT